MKIVHISSATTGGAGIAAYRLHLGLIKEANIESSFIQKDKLRDLPPNVFKCEPYYPLIYKLKKYFNQTSDDYYNKIISKYPADYEIASIPVAPFRIENHPIVREADIINLHWAANFLNYPTFFKNIEQPIVWTLHDMNPFQGLFHYEEDIVKNKPSLGVLDRQAREEKANYIHQKDNLTIVSPSQWLKQKSETSDTLKQYPHRVIPNGLDFSLYPISDRNIAKKELQVDNDKKTILFAAHLSENHRKGFDLLRDAVNRLETTDFNLISVGGKETLINSNINHIHFNHVNEVSELNKIYSAADVTVLPSREDNLPNIMLESMANGTPVISFANGGMAEHIETGMNGILINEINADMFSKSISDFLNNNYNFDNIKIRKYALNHFSDKIQAERYVQLYNSLLNR